MLNKISASELSELQQKFELKSIPSTARGILLKAERESWPSEQVAGKGGKGGIKNIFSIPAYVIEEMEEKGVLHLIESAESSDTNCAEESIHASRRPIEQDYTDWVGTQDRHSIAPVRYYKHVFASAGSGAIPWDTSPESMWFRDSFFSALGVKPADCFCTRIDGDSMFPTLIDQGTALWHATGQYTREGIYLIRQYNELRVKRLQRVSSTLYNIISDNPNKSIYPTTELDLSKISASDFEIYGKYLWSCGIAK